MKTLDTTFAIIILVGVIYFILTICAILFFKSKKKGFFTQTVDPKPQQRLRDHKELNDQ